MSDREKLIALYDKAIQYAGGICAGHGCDTCRYGECRGDCYEAAKVDYLLANGVVVRETGEWVLTDARFAEMSCSLCGFTYYGEYDKECMSDFCPNCGADMR